MLNWVKNYWMVVLTLVTTLVVVGVILDNPREDPVVASVAPVVAKVETQEITPIKVITLKPEAKRKLKLPKAIQADTKQHVTAATQVEPSERPVVVTSVFDEDTGSTTTYITEEPRPWIGFRDRGFASLAYGIKPGGPVVRLTAAQEFAQVKAIGLGAIGHIDSDGEYFVGVGGTYRW